jgi:FAD/FMN-containing dehydrogenase
VAIRPRRRADYRSWGGTLISEHLVSRPSTRQEACDALHLAQAGMHALPFGCGRSYGDVGLNPGGMLIDCRSLDRFIDFDAVTGIVTCEAGVRLADILVALCRPELDGGGWFLPVSPGTRFVTIGGAIANDVHGKNHHRQGCIGEHIVSFELARGDGSVTLCSREENPQRFAATIGGLGLTGLILTARLQLRRVAGTGLEIEDIRLDNLVDFFATADESEAEWEYTAAWIDCLASGASLGRGVFTRARHHPGMAAEPPPLAPRITVPMAPPISPLNRFSLAAFNWLYLHWTGRGGVRHRIGDYEPVLYPLDRLGDWNRLYGSRGFFQFQCAVPEAAAPDAVREMMERIAASGEGSMLAVLKNFGNRPSPGMLSFPMTGATLALDFPDRGAVTRQLLGTLEDIVVAAGGRLYPAKDAVMRQETFWRGYPRAAEFQQHIDPALSSAFARRVGLA